MIIRTVLTKFLCRGLLVLIVALGCAPAFAQVNSVPDLNSITAAVDRHYDRLHSLRADFVENYRAEGVERTESGALWLERGGRMRWEYSRPQPKLFVSDGHEAYFYVAGDREAQKSSMKQLDDMRSPLRYLLGKTKLRKELDQLTINPEANGTVMLEGVPRAMSDRIAKVSLEITGSQITGITITGSGGSVTEFCFSNAIDNPPVKPDLFRFIPPSGVQVVDTAEISNQ